MPNQLIAVIVVIRDAWFDLQPQIHYYRIKTVQIQQQLCIRDTLRSHYLNVETCVLCVRVVGIDRIIPFLQFGVFVFYNQDFQ